MLRKQQFEVTAFNPSTYEMLFIHYIFIESLLHVRHCDSQVASFGPFPQLLHRSLPRRLTGMDYTNGPPCSLAFSAIWPVRVLARNQIERKKGGQVPIHRPMVPPKAVFFSQFSFLWCGRITLLNSSVVTTPLMLPPGSCTTPWFPNTPNHRSLKSDFVDNPTWPYLHWGVFSSSLESEASTVLRWAVR